MGNHFPSCKEQCIHREWGILRNFPPRSGQGSPNPRAAPRARLSFHVCSFFFPVQILFHLWYRRRMELWYKAHNFQNHALKVFPGLHMLGPIQGRKMFSWMVWYMVLEFFLLLKFWSGKVDILLLIDPHKMWKALKLVVMLKASYSKWNYITKSILFLKIILFNEINGSTPKYYTNFRIVINLICLTLPCIKIVLKYLLTQI